jgi:hypothetical protein
LKIISANPAPTLKKRHLQLSDRVFRIKASIGMAAKRKWEAGEQTGTEAIVVRLEHRKFYPIATAAQTPVLLLVLAPRRRGNGKRWEQGEPHLRPH